MNLKEFINKVIIEENLKSDDIESIVEEINNRAKEKAIDHVACLSDEEVKSIIVEYVNNKSNEEVKETPAPKEEVKDGKSKQISLFENLQTF